MVESTLDRPAARRDRVFLAVLMVALVAFGPLSTDMYLPSLPSLERVFATDAATVQLTLSVFLLGFALGQLFFGPLSDRFGRKPVLLGGLALYALASAACLAAPTIEWLIAGRFFQALGACCGPVLGVAMARDVYEGPRLARIMAFIATATSIAPAVGPVLGGALEGTFGWQASFVFMAVFGVLVSAVALAGLSETNVRRDPTATDLRRMAGNYATLFRNRRYVGYILIANFGYSAVFSFISGSSFVLIGTIGLSPQQFGFSFATMVVGYMAGTILSGRLVGRWGVDGLIARGTTLASIGGLIMLFLALRGFDAAWQVLAPAVLFSIGIGMVQPNARAGAIAPFPMMAGLASALMGFTGMVIAAGLGALVVHFDQGTGVAMAAAIAGASLVAQAVFRFLLRGG